MAGRSIRLEKGRLAGSGEVYLCDVGQWDASIPTSLHTKPPVTPQALTRPLAIHQGESESHKRKALKVGLGYGRLYPQSAEAHSDPKRKADWDYSEEYSSSIKTRKDIPYLWKKN